MGVIYSPAGPFTGSAAFVFLATSEVNFGIPPDSVFRKIMDLSEILCYTIFELLHFEL